MRFIVYLGKRYESNNITDLRKKVCEYIKENGGSHTIYVRKTPYLVEAYEHMYTSHDHYVFKEYIMTKDRIKGFYKVDPKTGRIRKG